MIDRSITGLKRWARRAIDRIAPGRFSSEHYWERRYREGGNSGPGSYNHLARFKADVLNDFVAREGIQSVIEFGCGDGNQLALARYPSYTGYDVSPTAIAICRAAFPEDSTKEFHLLSEYDGRQADLALSLDVIFHLVEDDVFVRYMKTLFGSASRFVAIYSSDRDDDTLDRHVRHRNFSKWVAESRPDWRLAQHIPNRHPYDGDYARTSFADLFIYIHT